MPGIHGSKKMISFEPYIRNNYTSACEKLRKLVFVKAEDMKAMLIRGDQDIALIKTSMGGYNLLRGISTEDRDMIAMRFLSFSLNELREKHKEVYPHDIRIIDQLLWRIGKPK